MYNLRCNHCQKKFKTINFTKTKLSSYGLYSCECQTFPIVEGIPYFLSNAPQIVVFIRRKQYFQAFCITMGWSKARYIPLLGAFLNFFVLSKMTFSDMAKSLNNNILWKIAQLVIGKESASYFRNREKEVDSSFMFVVTSLNKASRPYHWLNVGAGIQNYYRKIKHIRKNTLIYSMEKSFPNCFLSRLLYSPSDAITICADVAGKALDLSTFQLISFFDTIQSIPKGEQIVKQIYSRIDKSKTHILISGIPTKPYEAGTYKLRSLQPKKVSSLLDNNITLLNDEIIAQNIISNTHRSITLNLEKPLPFKYSCIYPRIALKNLKFTIPASVRKKITFYWRGPGQPLLYRSRKNQIK